MEVRSILRVSRQVCVPVPRPDRSDRFRTKTVRQQTSSSVDALSPPRRCPHHCHLLLCQLPRRFLRPCLEGAIEHVL